MSNPTAIIVLAETMNTSSSVFPSRVEALMSFVQSYRGSKYARGAVDRFFFCYPNTKEDMISAMGTSEEATFQMNTDSVVIDCKKRGDAFGVREAARQITDPETAVMILCYPGTFDWDALRIGTAAFEEDPNIRVASFRSEFDPESTRGTENIVVKAGALKVVTESAMFQTLVDYENDAWADVLLAMMERLLVTQGEIKRLPWFKDESILQCDRGDRVVFAEQGTGDDEALLTVYRGRIDSVDRKKKKAAITFDRDDGTACTENIAFDLFRVVRRYRPVCHLEDLDATCFRLRSSVGHGTISQGGAMCGFRDILETLDKCRVVTLLTQITADATANARDFFSQQGKLDPEVIEGMLVLSQLDGIRQTAALTGHVADFPMEDACSVSWEGRFPLALLTRKDNETCELVPMTLDRLLETRDAWFRGPGRRATRAFLLAYCGKARVSIEGL